MQRRQQQVTGSASGGTVSGRIPGHVRPARPVLPESTPSGSLAGPPLSMQRSAVGPSHGRLGLANPAATHEEGTTSGPAKKQRKERLPNWSELEILALVESRRILNLEQTDSTNGRDLMTPDMGKWQRVSEDVMGAGVSKHLRDGPSCKSKWNQLIPEYKRIVDFMSRTGTNERTYWTMHPAMKKAEGLPKSFHEDVFYRLHEWYGDRPSVKPPHTRDLLAVDDENLRLPGSGPDEIENVHDSANFDEENVDDDVIMSETEDSSPSMKSASVAATPAALDAAQGLPTLSPSVRRDGKKKASLPEGVNPVLLSSSEGSKATARRRHVNTAVRRKHVSGHSLIAEATRASGDAMSGKLKEIADASRQLEESKIEVQLKLFSEQMQYQRDRDRRLQETAKLANDNAKLSIEKQAEVVHCLAQLASVLSSGLHSRQNAPIKSSVPDSDSNRNEGTQAFESAIAPDAIPGGTETTAKNMDVP